jgi:4-hydroxy-tetrahydrodipicolinate synthase
MLNMQRKVWPAMVTAIDSNETNINGGINYNGMVELGNYLIEGGVDGLLIAGCTGHAASLSEKEQIDLVAFMQKELGSRTEIIAGDGSNSTRAAIELTKRVEGEAGVFKHVSISPYQNKPEQEGIFEHCTRIADAIKGDMIIYSVKGRTGGLGILPETAVRLAQHPNIVAIKEASGLDRAKKTLELLAEKGIGPEEFCVLSGDDENTLEMMQYGAMGAISVAANVDPEKVSFMVHNFDLNYSEGGESSRLLNHRLKNLYKVLFLESNPQPTHCALNLLRYNAGVPRLPLMDVRPETGMQIRDALYDLDLL